LELAKEQQEELEASDSPDDVEDERTAAFLHPQIQTIDDDDEDDDAETWYSAEETGDAEEIFVCDPSLHRQFMTYVLK
jgi:hypothetical protein